MADFLTQESPATSTFFVHPVRDRDGVLEENEFRIVPRGMEHCPVAEEEAVVNERTLETLDRI